MSSPESNHSETDADTTAPIEVLLVDDNEQWAEFLSSDLEREGPLEVTVSLNANEALMALGENPDIECVVADYMMPEIDGIQLLERVREDRPDLPFIFLTGQGSEDVASKAIKAGVSDYFRKDPSVDQTPLLANRIQQAVEQHRLQRELEESEERYRTITEQIWDGIVILRDGEVRFCNERLADLTGYDAAELDGSQFIDTVVHPDDEGAIRSVIADVKEGETSGDVFETRLVTKDEGIRDCEYTIRKIPYENEAAQIASIRDVTERKNRERNLRRERELNRTVQAALIQSRNREELESEVAALLSEFGYELVWIGEKSGSTVEPRTIEWKSDGEEAGGKEGAVDGEMAGSDGPRYLDEISLSTDDSRYSEEPSVWTARTGDPQFVGDFEEMFSTEWRNVALECGYRTGAALPLRYDDVMYGILAVYHTDPHAVDDDEQELLLELAQTLAFAIHHTEVKKALSSRDVIETELALTDTEYYVTELAAGPAVDVANVEITVDGTHPYGDETTMQYLTLDGISLETFQELATEHPAVEDTVVISETEPVRVQLTVTEKPPELTLAAMSAVVGSTTVTPESATLRVELPARSNLSDVVDALETEHGAVDIRSKVVTEREIEAGPGMPIETADLTEKQAAALRAAYHHGYYEQPRKSSAKEIADSLGVVHSTYLQHLRTAQQKVFSSLYESASGEPGSVEKS